MSPTTRRSAALALVLVAGGVATANKTHYEDITLEKLAKQSAAIVVVHVGEPAERQLTVAIGAGQPNFHRRQRMFVVDEVIKGPAALRSKSWWVDSAHWRKDLALHKQYYIEKISKSPIYERYTPTQSAEQGAASFIAFLRKGEQADDWELAADDAIESINSKALVVKAAR